MVGAAACRRGEWTARRRRRRWRGGQRVGAGQEDKARGGFNGLSGRWGGSRVSASGIARERAKCGSENFCLAGGSGLSVAGPGLG
jgi:hypothetical protein